jgi:hypothetical protein
MPGPQARRTGLAALVVTGLALTGSAVHGIGGMDSSLQLAAQRDEPRTLVDHHWCPDDERAGAERS